VRGRAFWTIDNISNQTGLSVVIIIRVVVHGRVTLGDGRWRRKRSEAEEDDGERPFYTWATDSGTDSHDCARPASRIRLQ
jgi:hypothetical protein